MGQGTFAILICKNDVGVSVRGRGCNAPYFRIFFHLATIILVGAKTAAFPDA
jgi:hypothetical protein